MIPIHVQHVPGADPERDRIVARLQSEAEVCLHTDTERRGVMKPWLEVLACAANSQDRWVVLLQDDAEPATSAPDWQQHLTKACWHSPEPVLGLTYFGQYGLKALDRGAPYGVGKNLLWGGAIAYRRDFLDYLADWAPQVVAETGFRSTDRLSGAAALRRGHRAALTARAIFDQPVQRSLLGHNTKIRRPAATIASHPGPGYAAMPRSAPVSAGVHPAMKELAAR